MKIKNLFIYLPLITLVSCSASQTIKLENQNISHETKFGGVYIETTIQDFNNLGFSFGDSLNITFSNGYVLNDLPYYNGYYVDNLAPLLVGYPGYPYIRAGFNNGDDMWELLALHDDDKANIKLNKKGKYLDIQEAMDIHYSDEQGDLPDEIFGNFRSVNVGNLKENILYRSASPVDNQHKRAPVVDRLINNKVNTIIDLSDDDDELAGHLTKSDFNSPYAKSIYDQGNIIALSMNMNFQLGPDGESSEDVSSLFTEFKNEAFHQKLIKGIRFMINHDGPYLVHCVEGKDRTGFVIMVLSAFAGATYEEIIDDYMVTYDNYYGINKRDDLSKYNIIKQKNIDVMLKTLIADDNVDIRKADYSLYAENYLLNKGLEENEITILKQKLLKN